MSRWLSTLSCIPYWYSVLDLHRLHSPILHHNRIQPVRIQPLELNAGQHAVAFHTAEVAINLKDSVGASLEEPVPGWVQGLQSATGNVVSFSAGLLRMMYVNANSQANFVPVDKVASGIIALAYTIASQKWTCSKDGKDVPVVNFVAKSFNCLTLGDFTNFLQKYVYENPSQRLYWYPLFSVAQHRWTANLSRILLHNLPATIIDFVTTKIGRPTELRRLYQVIHSAEDVKTYFLIRQFDFEEKNVENLWNMLEPQDQRLFPFKMDNMIWSDYMETYVLGVRRYLLKEDDSTLERTRFKVKVLYAIHLTTISMVILFFCNVTWSVITLFGVTF